jgi:hypothetical protein
LPVDLTLYLVTVAVLGSRFRCQLETIGKPSIQALATENSQFRLRDVQPTTVLRGVVVLQLLDQASGLLGRESFVKRSWFVGVEIVLHQQDLPGLRVLHVDQILDCMHIVDRRPPFGRNDVSLTAERLEHHK